MLRRSFWKYVSVVAVPCFALAFSGTVSAQDKPTDKPKGDAPAKPAEKPKADDKKPEAKAEKDIVETAMGNKDFSTLVDLLKAADLVDTLKGAGPFTVFAPTNAAFDKVGKEALEGLKKDKAKLGAVLKYHVASGNMVAADVAKAKTIKTVQGSELTVTTKDKDVMVDKAKVTATDIKCKNGVIHVIDAVVMPADKPAK